MTKTGLSNWALWFGGLAFFACYLGQTVLGVVQPTIAAELGLGDSEAQWVVNVFFLTLALFAAPGGRLGDYYGHREVLLIALGVFALGSALAAAAQTFAWLIAGIGIAGMGASTLYPSSAAMVANRVPLEHRGDALGKYSAIGVTVFVLGPLAAGLLTEAISWRALFGLQAAIGVAVVAIGWLRVDNRPVGEPARFDLSGFVVLAAALSALLVGLMQALAWGWDAPATVVLVLAGIVGLGLFARLELGRAHPLLDVSLLRRPAMRGIAVAMFAAQFALNGFIIYIATYFQHVLEFGPLLAAMAMTPALLLGPVFNILAGRVTDRVGPRRPAVFGYLLSAACFAWIAIFLDQGSYWLLFPGIFALSIGIAPMFTSLLTGLSNAVAAEERGDANALVLTLRWIGAATGTAILGIVIQGGSGAGPPSAGPYTEAFALLTAVAIVGALACALLLRDPGRLPPSRPT